MSDSRQDITDECIGCVIKKGCTAKHEKEKCPCVKCLVKTSCTQACRAEREFFEDAYYGGACI